MIIRHAEFSHVGPRKSNQDRVLLPTTLGNGYTIAAIADGIGGAEGGAEAAEVALDHLRRLPPNPEALAHVVPSIVDAFRVKATDEPNLRRMGTTLTAMLFADDKAFILHVGDTRIYHIRGEGLNTLTEDQTEVAALLRKGVLSERQAKRYPRRNVLTSAVSASGEYELYQRQVEFASGDRFLFLTDGAYRRATRAAVIAASQASAGVGTFVTEIERIVATSDPSDNYSGMAIEVDTG